MFTDKIVVITGGAHGIGLCCAEEFLKAGARVIVIDKNPVPSEGIDSYIGDISRQDVLEDFAAYITKTYGQVDCLIHNAPPPMRGIDSCTYDEFMEALAIGVTAPFYLTKLTVS